MAIIISDTSTMYSTDEAREAGFAVSPLAVTISGESYRELDEMTHERFVAIINEGHMPTSSQPAIGEVMALYEEFAGEEILNIAMADGLSGTYSSAATMMKRSPFSTPERSAARTAAWLSARRGWRRKAKRLPKSSKRWKR